MLRRIGRLTFRLIPLWTWRVVVYASVAAVLVVGGTILGLRYWVLPNIDEYRGDLERALTRATGQRITIGELAADWHGLRPEFSLGKVVVYDQADRPALELARIDTELSWVSLIVFEPRFDALQIHRPHLAVRRAPDGTFSVAGIELGKTKGGGGLADWLFRQHNVTVTEAVIAWTDEQRRAPELRLGDVTLTLQNDYFRHRLELGAVAPPELAGRLELRADLVGRSVTDISAWEGQFYVRLDAADLAASKQWIDLPIEIAHGRGAVRATIDVAQQRVTAVTADVELSDVKTRLAPELAELDLASLSGRIGWRGWKGGFEVSARGLRGIAVAGHNLASEVLSVRRIYEQPSKPARTEVNASFVDLDVLAQLAEHLPIEQTLRAEIKRYGPRGKLYELKAKWTGDWGTGQFELASRFEELAFHAVDAAPGWRNVTGSVDFNEKGGVLNLAKHPLHIDLPKVFAEPLVFDEFSGGMRWSMSGAGIDFRLSDLRFANADLAGTLSGTFHRAPGEAGRVDLTGALTRASAAGAARYIPLMIGKETRDWVRSSVIAGHSKDVKLRLKGNLAEFPFDRNKQGVFEVTAKARDAVVDYANGWPRIENVTADLVFTGRRMSIRAGSGRILGAQVSGLQATIPDLVTLDEILELGGDAAGPTAEFVRFIAESPVAGMIDRATEGMAAEGAGRLSLRLTMPLRRLKDTRVAGSYLFQENRLRVHPDLPALEQVTGRVEFTEAAVRGQGITGRIFGGPVTFALATEGGTVTATGSGRSNVDALREYLDSSVLQGLSGSAEWRASMRMRAKQADFTIDSDLVGLGSALPAPLGKVAQDALALRLERRANGNDSDQIDLRLGKVLTSRFVRKRVGQQLVVERGAIGLGAEPPAAEAPGLWIRGALANLDLDRWRSLATAAPGDSAALPPLAGMDLKFGTLDMLGRRFHDVALVAGQHAGDWRARVSARELSGEIGWRPQGKGQIVARLQRLSLPASTEQVSGPGAEPAGQPVEYPALDVLVEDFQHGSRSLGRLQVLAVAEGQSWRIERLELSNADGTLTANGLWHWQARVPRTELQFQLKVADIGKFLARLGYPEGVKGGTANLKGALSWSGAPQNLDPPSLAGTMRVDAAKGQFVKLEPGIGKLLSILSLQALPRRVTLDFKDVFSEGFAFDNIVGEVKVRSGIASTESFRINGSSASVGMSGEVDLARETQKLRVRVVPSIGDSVATVTALLGGPIAGIGVFLAQRLLDDPLGKLVAYDYSVTGTWADPTIVKLGIDRAEPS